MTEPYPVNQIAHGAAHHQAESDRPGQGDREGKTPLGQEAEQKEQDDTEGRHDCKDR